MDDVIYVYMHMVLTPENVWVWVLSIPLTAINSFQNTFSCSRGALIEISSYVVFFQGSPMCIQRIRRWTISDAFQTIAINGS